VERPAGMTEDQRDPQLVKYNIRARQQQKALIADVIAGLVLQGVQEKKNLKKPQGAKAKAAAAVASILQKDLNGEYTLTWKDVMVFRARLQATPPGFPPDDIPKWLHELIKELGDSHCLPRAVARYVFGDSEMYYIIRLLMGVGVRDSPDWETLIADDITLPPELQRKPGMESYIASVVGGDYLGHGELVAIMKMMNQDAKIPTPCFIWHVNPGENIAEILAGPPFSSIPDGTVYDPHSECLRLVFHNAINPRARHWNTVVVRYHQNLPEQETCTECKKAVTTWFERTSRAGLGKMVCEPCAARLRCKGLYHDGSVNIKEEALPAEAIKDGRMVPEWVNFVVERNKHRGKDILDKPEKASRTTAIGVTRFSLSKVMFSKCAQEKLYRAIEQDVTKTHECDCVCYRVDPENGQPNHLMCGGLAGARLHFDSSSGKVVSYLINFKDQDQTFTQTIEFDFHTFFLAWCVFWQTTSEVMKTWDPESVKECWGDHVMKSDDPEMQAVAAFTAIWATKLMEAVKDMPDAVHGGKKAVRGEVCQFLSAKKAHQRPSGDQSGRLISFTALRLRQPDEDDVTWQLIREQIISGEWRNKQESTEQPFVLDLEWSPSKEESEKQAHNKELFHSLQAQLIEAAFRSNDDVHNIPRKICFSAKGSRPEDAQALHEKTVHAGNGIHAQLSLTAVRLEESGEDNTTGRHKQETTDQPLQLSAEWYLPDLDSKEEVQAYAADLMDTFKRDLTMRGWRPNGNVANLAPDFRRLRDVGGEDPAAVYPTWRSLLARCSDRVDNLSTVWKKDGDNLTFMSLVLCELIRPYEPMTAHSASADADQKFQRGIYEGDHGYVTAALKIGRPVETPEQGQVWLVGKQGVYLEYLVLEKELNVAITKYTEFIGSEEQQEFLYAELTNQLVGTWAREICAKGEAPTTIRAVYRILALLSMELQMKEAKIVTVLANLGRLSVSMRHYLYLFTHCAYCVCEYGLVALRSSRLAGVFDTYEIYNVANTLFQALTSQYMFPADASLHKVIEHELEVVCEVAAVIVLMEKPGMFQPPGMKITPLHVYRVMNAHMMNDDGTFKNVPWTRPSKKKEERKDPYREAHHYITFCFLRAVLERSWIWKRIPQRLVRTHSWLSRESELDMPMDVMLLIEQYMCEMQ
jgi:hypothetical protein